MNSGKVERISLPPEIERSAPRLQADFRAGRFAAGIALQAMGYDGLVARCERGLPVCPGGLLGSISHTAEYASAAVVRKQQVAGIGVDCERLLATAVASESWQLVGTAGERDLISRDPQVSPSTEKPEGLFLAIQSWWSPFSSEKDGNE
ncbi:MAG: hypothetical protein VX768_13760 [Planctomycetota bacterium]|nr:hypothetical protein [Planctomycetota bacterium]